MKYSILLILTILSFTSFSQSKEDYIWILGTDRSPDPGVQAYRFDFSIKPFTIVKSDNGVELAQNNASISDKDGNLLLYTNGCAVLNRNAEIMPRGDSINEDYWKELSGWDDCVQMGYPGTQNSIILNDPGDDNQYYVLHKPRVFDGFENPTRNHLRYTLVDMALDGGLGDVIEKDIDFYTEKNCLSSYLTAIRHKNKKDWWIVQPLQEDSLFVSFLITENGIEKKEYQNSYEFFRKSGTSSAGTARFSPDGTKYALYAYKNNLHIYDFDRSDGLITNHQEVIIYDSIDFSDIRFNSVEWSSNSRFIYTASRDDLHQIDTWEEDPQDGVVLIDSYDGTQNPFSNTFFLMAQGPDCRIYMCSTSANAAYHVINHPDSLGVACDFVQNGIVLPYEAGFGSMPNFPRFRVDEVEKCDPTIVSIFGNSVWYRRDLEVFPNPSSGIFHVNLPDDSEGELIVFDMKGNQIEMREVTSNTLTIQINLSGLPNGNYVLEFYPEKNSERIFYSSKMVLTR